MNDKFVRRNLIAKLRTVRNGTSTPVIIEEFGVLHGLGRVDILVAGTYLHGYEIKSDSDTLERFDDQIRLFSTSLDKITVVSGFRHAAAVLERVPKWWGVQLVEKADSEKMIIYPARSPRLNPKLEPLSMAKLLWKKEALSLLSQLGEDRGFKSKPRENVYARLAQVAPLSLIRRHLTCSLLKRETTALDERQTSNGDSLLL